MSSKSKTVSLSSGTVLSIFCLLLYSAGFIRIERVKLNNHEERLVAVEELISKMSSQTSKNGMDDTSTEGRIRGGLNSDQPHIFLQISAVRNRLLSYTEYHASNDETKPLRLSCFFPRAFSFT